MQLSSFLSSNYCDHLNPQQDKAVKTLEGPLLVLAGAGTGKTRVLTTRLAHILYTQKALPGQILAVTFTNKAAREMQERVTSIIGPAAKNMWLGTFHSIAMRILKRQPEKVGLKPYFSILDREDQLRVVKQILKAEQISTTLFSAKSVLYRIQNWKDRCLTHEKIDPSFDERENTYLRLYRLYQERLQNLNSVDFGDLLLYCLELFKTDGEILSYYQKIFKYILVDEYQDTNTGQYLFLRLLAKHHNNICCVGDDDQSIYSWRGAEIQNILSFEKDFPSAVIVRLEQNYRSTMPILQAASHLIAYNTGRLGKNLWTHKKEGELIKVFNAWDGKQEAQLVADIIEKKYKENIALSNIAILVRAGFQTREFEERFITIGLPYRVIGGLRFYERLEIKDAIAYLRLVCNVQDNLAFERIINTPKRGIGPAALQIVHKVARCHEVSLYKAVEILLTTDELRPAVKRHFTYFVQNIQRWQDQLDRMPHPKLAEIILDESGYMQMWMHDKSPEASGRLENLKEFIHALEEFTNLNGFLEHVSLVMDNHQNTDQNEVSIMTLHSAKGLEFDYVFLPGWEENIFPHYLALEENGDHGLEEERRLAYVGLTRAGKEIFISYANNRCVHNNWQANSMSRFIKELPKKYICHAPKNTSSQERYRVNTSYINQTQFDSSSFYSHQATHLSLGARVSHTKFGYGTITQKEGDHIGVEFEKEGFKRVLASFLTLSL